MTLDQDGQARSHHQRQPPSSLGAANDVVRPVRQLNPHPSTLLPDAPCPRFTAAWDGLVCRGGAVPASRQ